MSATGGTASMSGVTLTDKLCSAASKGEFENVHELLQMGAGFELDRDGRTALHYAALNGYASICKLFIQHGCDLDARDIFGCTSLHRSASQGHLEVISVLLKAGCTVDLQDEHGNAALHEAAWNGFSKSIELLVKQNCSVVITNKTGFTALHLAVQNGHNESCRVLLYASCNADLKNNYGDTALHTAARYGHAGVTRILISAKCSLNEVNKNGDTSLHIAAALKRRKIAKLLVEAGIDSNMTNKQNETAAEVARRKEHPQIIPIIASSIKPDLKNLPQHVRKVYFHPDVKPSSKDIVMCPDDVGSDKLHKPEKKKFSFFKKKKEKEKVKDITSHRVAEGKNITKPEGLEKEHVRGFFSQYIPRNGFQYYKDLAGNIKQGPIGYAPVCQCVPVLRNIEKRVEVARESIYDHIDASHKMLQNHIGQLDKKHIQQMFAIDKLTKKGSNLNAEGMAHYHQITEQYEKTRKQLLNQYHSKLRTNIEEWLEEKLAVQQHCFSHHHDDSVLPSSANFVDTHADVQGRLFRAQSDETLSQSENHNGGFRKKKFYESRQAAMQQIRGWQVPTYDKKEHIKYNSVPLAASTPENVKKVSDRQTNGIDAIFNEQSSIGVGSIHHTGVYDSGDDTKNDYMGPNCTTNQTNSVGPQNTLGLQHSTPKNKEYSPFELTRSLFLNQSDSLGMSYWISETEHQNKVNSTDMNPQSSTSASDSQQENRYTPHPVIKTVSFPKDERQNYIMDSVELPYSEKQAIKNTMKLPPFECSQSSDDKSVLFTSQVKPKPQIEYDSTLGYKNTNHISHRDNVNRSACTNISLYKCTQSPETRFSVMFDGHKTENESEERLRDISRSPVLRHSTFENCADIYSRHHWAPVQSPHSQKMNTQQIQLDENYQRRDYNTCQSLSLGEYSVLGARNPQENPYVTVNSVQSVEQAIIPVRSVKHPENYSSAQNSETMYSNFTSPQELKCARKENMPNPVKKSEPNREDCPVSSQLGQLHTNKEPYTFLAKSAHGITECVTQPHMLSKEDSSSNPDSGYSSKIYGDHANSAAHPSSSGSTPVSSFGTERSFSLKNCPQNNHTAGHQYSLSMSTGQHSDSQCNEESEQDWYHQQLQEAAQKLTGDLNLSVTNKNACKGNHQSWAGHYNNVLIQGTQARYMVPDYVRGSDV